MADKLKIIIKNKTHLPEEGDHIVTAGLSVETFAIQRDYTKDFYQAPGDRLTIVVIPNSPDFWKSYKFNYKLDHQVPSLKIVEERKEGKWYLTFTREGEEHPGLSRPETVNVTIGDDKPTLTRTAGSNAE